MSATSRHAVLAGIAAAPAFAALPAMADPSADRELLALGARARKGAAQAEYVDAKMDRVMTDHDR
jgi:hypothetical protein